jgi:hypothetical protein
MKEINQDLKLKELLAIIENKPINEKVILINELRELIHKISPFKKEPVDFVKWIYNENVIANDYNPNKVAPPEMQLLEVSIINDGYTQPIVTFPDGDKVTVIDGFHRNRVGKESLVVKDRIQGFLPTVIIRPEVSDKNSRMASTIRHNRARGKHQVSAMSEIVMELKNRNWSNKRISRELGMDEDEILRLCQVSGLENLFKDNDFNKAWVSNDDNIDDFKEFLGEVDDEDYEHHKIPNESDVNRIFHPYQDWELINYNFYGNEHLKWSKLQCEYKYKEILGDIDLFKETMQNLSNDCPKSCEHNLTNRSMNRIAFLGQASVAYKYKIPCIYSSGFQLLTDEEKIAANNAAFEFLNNWLTDRGLEKVTLDEALLINRQVELY